MASGGKAAVFVHAHSGPRGNQIVNQGVAGAGVEGDQFAVLSNPGDIGDAADIDQGQRRLQPGGDGKGAVIGRHQRSALPSGGNVGAAEVPDDIDAGGPCQRLAVAKLDGDAAFRGVKHRLAVKADKVDLAACQAGLAKQGLDGAQMGGIDHRGGGGESRRRDIGGGKRRGGKRGTQHFALLPVVGLEKAGARLGDPLAVGAQNGGVDAVQRGAAHHAQNGQNLIAGGYIHFHLTRALARHCWYMNAGNWAAGKAADKNGRLAMTSFKSEFLHTLFQRGFIHQCSDPGALDQALTDGTVTAYIGFDCTAASLHAGSLLPIMMLRWLQKTGHRPIALMGGGTTKVGDPSGKDESRQLLSVEKINENLAGIRRIFDKFLTFGSGPGDAIMANNADWLDQLNYIDFLRDYGRHFTINRMLSFDSVKLRLDREQPLTFLEFNYMILQAYDFLELNRRTGCTLQMGGSDQWGNIINGIELARRADGAQLYALTTPLLTTSSGAKMGKTADGAVWLDGDWLSPYDYWQYWRNTEDGDTARFLKLFTELPLEEIARLEKLEGQEINEAKKILANEATALLHGRAAAERAAETARKTFEEGVLGEDLPVIEIASGELEAGLGLLRALVAANFATSNGEARRAVEGGAVRVNDAPITDVRAMLGPDALNAQGTIKLSLGKKRHALIRPS